MNGAGRGKREVSTGGGDRGWDCGAGLDGEMFPMMVVPPWLRTTPSNSSRERLYRSNSSSSSSASRASKKIIYERCIHDDERFIDLPTSPVVKSSVDRGRCQIGGEDMYERSELTQILALPLDLRQCALQCALMPYDPPTSQLNKRDEGWTCSPARVGLLNCSDACS